ncbi:hypothetical protein ACOME3_007551 [Neoechinorhynchus agilis]
MVITIAKDDSHISTDPNNVLVTGGTGLIGKAIQSVVSDTRFAASQTWYFLSSKDCDLTNQHDTHELMKCYYAPPFNVRSVIHLAAHVGGLFRNIRENYDFLQRNVLMNANVIGECVNLRMPRLVTCLSTCIFPDNPGVVLSEDILHKGPPHHSNYGYSHAKRLVDIYNKAAFEQYGLRYVSVVPTNVFGPHDNFNLENGHVLPGLERISSLLVQRSYYKSEVSAAKRVKENEQNSLMKMIEE